MATRSGPSKPRRSPLKKPARGPVWLLLVHQLPSRPSNVRVRTWRRLQDAGAVAIKNSVYVLPNSAQAQEDFEWIKSEIVSMKGQASVFAADSVDSLSHDEIVAAFRRMRQEDYAEIRREARTLLSKTGRRRPLSSQARRLLVHRAQLLRKHCDRITAVDFFAATGREETLADLRALDESLTSRGGASAGRVAKDGTLDPGAFRNQLWVTRPRPGIDRIASAWLIRRFIDPGAKFGFVKRAGDVPSAIPFDMFGVEFSHQGNDCTFETLCRRFGLHVPSLEWLGRIVHNLDLKDDKYAAPEAPGIGLLLGGLQQLYADDRELLESGMSMFEALHRSFAAARPAARRPAGEADRRGRKAPPRKPRAGGR